MAPAPSRSRGKTIALASACAGVALLILAAWLGRGWFVETWYIHRLRSTDEETRLEAAEKLGEMRSLRDPRGEPRNLAVIERQCQMHQEIAHRSR